MFIGEAPGREEDEGGRPFIGSAGKVLNKILFYVPFTTRKSSRISNIIKCRPPNNRPPTDQEIKNCLPYLLEEIKEINPTNLVALGSTATQALTGKDLTWRGMIVKDLYFNLPTLITYHPSYILRGNWGEISTVVHDISKLQNPPKEYSQEYILEPSDELLTHYLFDTWKDSPVAVDIETTANFVGGPDPYRDSIIGIGFCGEPGVALSLHLSNFSPQRWKIIKTFLEGNTPKVFQNNQFDRYFLLLHQGIKVKNMVWDTFDSMNLIKSDSPRDLDFLRSIYTNIPPYKHKYKKPWELPKEALGHYNCLDVDTTLQVSINQKPFITGKLKDLQKQTLIYNDIALDMQHRGVYINQEKLATNFLDINPKAESLKAQFYKDFYIDIDSPKQVSTLLFETLKLPPPPSAYKGKSLSVDETVLQDLMKRIYTDDRQILTRILEYRELAKILSTYIIGFYKLIKDDRRIHPEWKPTGTDTGRWACHKPNMQNIPRHLRGQIIAGPKKKLLIGDFTQLELLIISILSGETSLSKAITLGRDVHEEIRLKMNEIIPTSRVVAKTMVFGTMYGLSVRTASEQFKIPPLIIETLQSMVIKEFPKIASFRDELLGKYKSKGILETPFGRIKHCKSMTEALNYPVQSCASEVANRALVKIFKAGFNIILYIHDEIVVEEDLETDRLKEFESCFNDACPELSKVFPVKVREALTWEEAKE